VNPWNQLRAAAVLPDETNPDIVAEDVRQVFLPKTPETFVHDDDGNLTVDGRFTYVWDAENRLIAVESRAGAPAGSKVKETWTHRPDGRWLERATFTWDTAASGWQPAALTRFLWDGNVLLAELDAAGTLLRGYVRGLDLSGTMQGAGGVGGLLFLQIYSNSQLLSSSFYTHDGNGNVTAPLDAATGALAAEYAYGPFGEALRVRPTRLGNR